MRSRFFYAQSCESLEGNLLGIDAENEEYDRKEYGLYRDKKKNNKNQKQEKP